ncbi:MAG: Uma2 family endonuclease [Dehalococcoidia bacterium]
MRRSHGNATTTPTTATPAAIRSLRPVYYPSGDGKPMAESGLHASEMLRLIAILQEWFRNRFDINIGGNLFLYWVMGDPHQKISPDVYVAKGVPPEPLRTYQTWVQGVPPVVVIEVTSRSTRREDIGRKWERYAEIGVNEYYLYDPEGDWVHGRLIGYRLRPDGYQPMAELAEGGLQSEELGLRLALEAGRLQFYDPESGQRLPTPHEQVENARQQVENARQQVESAQQQVENAQQQAEYERQQAEYERQRGEYERQQLATERQRANAEARMRGEAEAARVAEAQRADIEVLARREAESRALTEAQRAEAEAEARRTAEARLARLEALLHEQPPDE